MVVMEKIVVIYSNSLVKWGGDLLIGRINCMIGRSCYEAET